MPLVAVVNNNIAMQVTDIAMLINTISKPSTLDLGSENLGRFFGTVIAWDGGNLVAVSSAGSAYDPIVFVFDLATWTLQYRLQNPNYVAWGYYSK